LAKDQAQGLYPFDRRDLSVGMEKLRQCMAGVKGECAAEATQLSRSVMKISDALVDLGVFPIREILVQPRSTQDVLMLCNHILERL
jgi:hypothetical protein